MKTPAILLTLAALASSASIGHAALVYGLTTSNSLVSFDSANPSVLLSNVSISGATGFVDIDVYPVNGLLYAMQSNGTGYTINPTTGVVTSRFTPSNQPSAGGFAVRDFDFNPAADRIRLSGNVTGNDDFNARMVPEVVTGGVAGPNPGGFIVDGDAGDATGGDGTYSGDIPNSTLNIVGNAYTNNFDGTLTTTLYSLDTGSERLLTHNTTPQFNLFTSIALTGATLGSNVGFDIEGFNSAYVSNGNTIYSLNLLTGALTTLGTVGGGVSLLSIAAVVPEPSYALLSLMGLTVIGLRRRRSLKSVN